MEEIRDSGVRGDSSGGVTMSEEIKPLHVVGLAYKLPHNAPQPETDSIAHWAIKKQIPAWLVAAMQAGRPVNAVFSEVEFHRLAEEIAGLPLGRT